MSDGPRMRSASRLLATLVAAAVWVLAGMSVASGPLATTAITPVQLDATAACYLRLGR